jgi:hypothetical protein
VGLIVLRAARRHAAASSREARECCTQMKGDAPALEDPPTTSCPRC